MMEQDRKNVLVVSVAAAATSRNMFTARLFEWSAAATVWDVAARAEIANTVDWSVAQPRTRTRHFESWMYPGVAIDADTLETHHVTTRELNQAKCFPAVWTAWEQWLQKLAAEDMDVYLVGHNLRWLLYVLHHTVERWRAVRGEHLCDVFQRLHIVQGLDTRPWLLRQGRRLRPPVHGDELYEMYRAGMQEAKRNDWLDFQSDAHCVLAILSVRTDWHNLWFDMAPTLEAVEKQCTEWTQKQQPPQHSELKPSVARNKRTRMGAQGDVSTKRRRLLEPLRPSAASLSLLNVQHVRFLWCGVRYAKQLGHVCICKKAVRFSL